MQGLLKKPGGEKGLGLVSSKSIAVEMGGDLKL